MVTSFLKLLPYSPNSFVSATSTQKNFPLISFIRNIRSRLQFPLINLLGAFVSNHSKVQFLEKLY